MTTAHVCAAEMSSLNRKLIQNLAETISRQVRHCKYRGVACDDFSDPLLGCAKSANLLLKAR